MTKEQVGFSDVGMRFVEWLSTPEGQAAIAESHQRVEDTKALLAKGRDIPWEKLHEPFTI